MSKQTHVPGMKLAIVGSRDLIDKALFARGIYTVLRHWGKPESVVSGGARGADRMAERWARTNKITITVFKPQWRVNGVYDRTAGIKRNADIIGAATHVLAFPSKKGRGTQDSIKRAKQRNLPLFVFYID